MAQLLMQALEQAGHEVTLASRYRSREAVGKADRQARLQKVGQQLAQRLIRHYQALPARQRPQLWFTYHLYYKAPDWIGPAVAKALKIPYVVAEASVAHKRANGPWSASHRAVLQALDQAAAVIALNPLDAKLIPDQNKVRSLKPFLDTAPYQAVLALRGDYRNALAAEQHLDPEMPWLLAAAMTRRGDKLASYQILAQALRAIPDMPWQLIVAGEGDAYEDVRQAFAWAMPERVRFLGLVQPAVMPALYAACDLMVWPAVNEAYGMALLEAQAAGLPVVAGRNPGVETVVAEGVTGYLCDPGLATFAASVREILTQTASRSAMGEAAPRMVAENHSLLAAARRLNSILEEASRR
ncbi:glycosyltransferase family 4 protein [Pelagibius litoralis]|nr:glycosyltransferase family 4 protein [Pelagibius litoralis]